MDESLAPLKKCGGNAFGSQGHSAHRNPRLLRFALSFLFLLVAVLAQSNSAAAKSWRISNFQDNITVSPDGSAQVSETITLVFVGEWHGIHRTIPIEYPGPDGTNYQLFLDVTSVTGEDGAKQYNEVTTAVGYACASDSRVHFGLGASKTIREIDIKWPSRIHQVLHNVAADQILTIEEPAQ